MNAELLWAWAPALATGSAVLTVALLLASVVALPRVLVALPVDAAIVDPPPPMGGRVLRNALGWTLVALGLLMLVLPGQGLLTLFAGLLLADFPGKARIIRGLLARAPVRRAVDAIRTRSGAPPLLDPAEASAPARD